MRAVVHSLLLAAAARGQPVVGPEITSTPFQAHVLTLPLPAQPVAVVDVNGGFVIAWLADNAGGRSRIYVARLDPTARVIPGAVRELPVTEPDVEAGYVSLGEAPNGYVVGWLEPMITGVGRAVVALLDRDLNVISGPLAIQETKARVFVGMFNGDVVAVAGVSMVRLDRDLRVVETIRIGAVADDVAITGDQLVFASHTSSRVQMPCGEFGTSHCPSPPPIIIIDSYDLFAVTLYRSTFTRHFNFVSLLVPAIATDGKESLIAWFDGYPERGATVLAARVDAIGIGPPLFLGLFSPDAGALEKPSIAWDGERYVVVWQDKLWFGSHEIRGAAIDSAQVTPFTVSETEAEEEHPTVVAVGRGRFLVADESTLAGQRRIAGRFIDFRGPRRRAAH